MMLGYPISMCYFLFSEWRPGTKTPWPKKQSTNDQLVLVGDDLIAVWYICTHIACNDIASLYIHLMYLNIKHSYNLPNGPSLKFMTQCMTFELTVRGVSTLTSCTGWFSSSRRKVKAKSTILLIPFGKQLNGYGKSLCLRGISSRIGWFSISLFLSHILNWWTVK